MTAPDARIAPPPHAVDTHVHVFDPARFPDQGERLAILAKRAGSGRLTAFAAWLQRQTAAVDHPLNPRLFCEDLLLRYSAVFD